MISCCGDGIELGDVIDILSLIIEFILGKEFCLKGALKKSRYSFIYKFLFRFFCLLVGMGFDLLSFHVNYPGFYSGYESTGSIMEKESGPLIYSENGFKIIILTITDFGMLLAKIAIPLVILSICIFYCCCSHKKNLKHPLHKTASVFLKSLDLGWTLAVILILY